MRALLVLGSVVSAGLLLAAACSGDKGDGTGGAGGTTTTLTGTGGTGGHTGGAGAGGGCAESTSKMDCAKVCPAVVAAKCENGPPTVEDCIPACDALNTADCPEWGGFVDCIGGSPTFICDDESTPTVAGCEAQQECFEACGPGQGGGGAGGGCAESTSKVDCAKICPAVVAAKCESGPPTVDACIPMCEELNASGCPEWGGYADCIGDSPTYGCNDEGGPTVAGCEAQEECMQPCFEGLGGGGAGGGK
jgi:hypothetical protein